MYIDILLNLLHVYQCPNGLFMSVGIKRPTWDRPPRLLLGCLQWLFCLVTWEGLSVLRSCLHGVDIVAGWDSTNATIPYPNQTHRGVSVRFEPWPHSNPCRPRYACVVRQTTPKPRLRKQAWSRDNYAVNTGGWWDRRHAELNEMRSEWQ